MKIKVHYCDQCPFLKDKQKINANVLACRLSGWEKDQDMNILSYTGRTPKEKTPPNDGPEQKWDFIRSVELGKLQEIVKKVSLKKEESKLSQEKIIEIAKKAVAANDTWADRATYKVKRTSRGWSVTVWRIEGYDAAGKPQFAVGGFRNIVIDKHGNVINYLRGY